MTHKTKKNDDDELPAHGTGNQDPNTYAMLSRPFPTTKAGSQALDGFTKAVHALRIKHGIADVTVLAAVSVQQDGQVEDIMVRQHSGDSAKSLPMIACAFRDVREHDRNLAMRLAGLDGDVFHLDERSLLLANRVANTLRESKKHGETKDWTPMDVIQHIVDCGLIETNRQRILMDLIERKPVSPAEELGVLAGEIQALVRTTAERLQTFHRRMESIFTEHPELRPSDSEPEGSAG